MTEPDAASPTSGESTIPPAGTAEPADLGILLVHGIGDQAQGETLTQMAEPLIAWIGQWLRTELPAESLIASAAVSAKLRPPLLDATTPAHARVLLRARGPEGASGEVRSERWLLAEAWWAPQVLAPPLGSFTAWLLTCSPWVTLFHFSQRWIANDLDGWRRFLIMALVTPIWMLFSLLASTVLVTLYLLALIPIGRLRAVFSTALRRLSGIVGDAYVKIRHPIQRRAMEDATLQTMTWLQPRCQRLVVIAHSQGAAIAHGALERDEAPHAHLFVTVGAGMAKLSALRYFQEELGGADRLAAALAAPLTLATVVVALRLRQLGLDLGWFWGPPATLGVLAFSFLVSAWTSVGRARADLLGRPATLSAERVGRWCDIVATHDPVPAGNLTQFFDLPAVEPRQVDVLRSVFKDHTHYWSAGTAFMPELVEELADCSHSTVVVINRNDKRFARASRILRRDLHVLHATAWMDAMAVMLPMVPLTLSADRLVARVSGFRRSLAGSSPGARAPFAFVDDALSTASEWLQWLTPLGDATADGVVNWCTAAAVLGLLWLAWRRLLFAMWTSWSANRTSEALRRIDQSPHGEGGKPSEYLAAALAPAVVNGLFLLVAAAPVVIASLWTFAPGVVNEASVYRSVGMVLPVMFLVMFALVAAGAALDEAVEVRGALAEASVRKLTWPDVQSGLRWVYRGLAAVAVVMALIGAMFKTLGTAGVGADLGRGLTDLAAPVMAGGMLLGALQYMLGRCWQLMGGMRPSLRTLVMLLPLAGGIVFALALRGQAEIGALLSVSGLVSVLFGAGLWAALRLIPRR